MELMKEFKQTEIGMLPEDWNVEKLKYIVEGNRIPSGIYKDKALYGQGNKIIKLGDVFNNDIFCQELAQRVKLTNEELSKYRVKIGDIFIALASVKLEGVGKVMLVNYLNEDTAYDHNVALIRPIEEVDKKYICEFFKSYTVRSLIASRATQVGTTFLKTSTILEFPLPLPPTKAEQTAIANALSDADAWIQSLTRLIAKKRQIKQGAMQTLLDPYKNGGLKEGWSLKKLYEICQNITTGKLDANAMIENGQYPFFTCAKDHYYIDKYAFDYEALLISGNGANVGYVHYYNGKFNAYQRTYVLSRFVCDVHFLNFYMTKNLEERIRIEVNAGNTPYIVMSTLTDMDVFLPEDKKMQSKIATTLFDMDKELASLETKLNKAKQIKQGMMQNLLTGRIRLI